MRKPTRKGLIRSLDKTVSLIVRKREPYCVICGTKENLTCGHLFSRANYATRWDLTNCHTQCMGDNMRHEFDWEPYRAWFVKEYGQEEYDALYKQHRTIRKWKDYELQELLTKYQKLLKEME